MSDPTKTERGLAHKATLVAVRKREYSEPIPDEFLPLFEAAGLVVDDNDHTVILYSAGKKYGAVWGPAVEGHWFANLGGDEAARVAGRDAGLWHVLERCSRCRVAAHEGDCCSSHGKPLCHLCYRRTHFVEVCVEGCPQCAREGLPVRLSDLQAVSG